MKNCQEKNYQSQEARRKEVFKFLHVIICHKRVPVEEAGALFFIPMGAVWISTKSGTSIIYHPIAIGFKKIMQMHGADYLSVAHI
jgi:hypothetical protein